VSATRHSNPSVRYGCARADAVQIRYEDNDFLLLFDPSKDGIAEAVAPALPDSTAFHVKDWFEPFNEHDRPVHPYQLLAPRPVPRRSGPSASD
jgi:hypothetical protein